MYGTSGFFGWIGRTSTRPDGVCCIFVLHFIGCSGFACTRWRAPADVYRLCTAQQLSPRGFVRGVNVGEVQSSTLQVLDARMPRGVWSQASEFRPML